MLVPDEVKAELARINERFADEFALELSEMEDRAAFLVDVRDLTTMSRGVHFSLPKAVVITGGGARLLKFNTKHAVETLRRARGAPSLT